MYPASNVLKLALPVSVYTVVFKQEAWMRSLARVVSFNLYKIYLYEFTKSPTTVSSKGNTNVSGPTVKLIYK